MSTSMNTVAAAEAAAVWGVPAAVVRLLCEARAVTVVLPRPGDSDGRTRLLEDEVAEPPADVAAALSNARALEQYLRLSTPGWTRAAARAAGAPLWVQARGAVGLSPFGDGQALALSVAAVPPWTMAHGERVYLCSVEGLAQLTQGWLSRRLVSVSEPERSDTDSRQVAWLSRLVPGWLTLATRSAPGSVAGVDVAGLDVAGAGSW